MRKSLKLLFILFLGVAFILGCKTKDSSAPTDNSFTSIDKTTIDHFSTVIGQVVSGEYQLASGIDDMVSDWEDLINDGSSTTLSFDAVSIELEDNVYYLVGVDDSEDATSKVRLVLDSGYFYEKAYYPDPEDETPQGSSCTCSGCKSTGPLSVNDCQPKQNELGWYCTHCPHGMGECVKSVTVTTGSGGGGVLN